MLAWNKANPSGEMPPILELRAVANGGNDRGGGLRSNAFNFRDSLARLACTKYPLDLPIKRRNPTIKVTKKIIELAERFSRHRRQFVLQIRKDLRDRPARAGNALGDGEAAIEQEPTDLTNDDGAMIDHSLSRPMQCLDVLLRDRLLRDKRDVRLPCSYTDRLRVIAVILLPAHKRLYILGADHLDPMAERLKLTRPIERAPAGLDDNGALTNLCQDSKELITQHPTLQSDTAVPVDAPGRSLASARARLEPDSCRGARADPQARARRAGTLAARARPALH